jgi:hypothetical protein
MAKKDSELFNRMRDAGLRKQVAKALSEIGDGASKKVVRAGRSAATELRSLADELERRLPGWAPKAAASTEAPAPRPPRPRRAPRRSSDGSAGGTGSAGRSASGAPTSRRTAAPSRTSAPKRTSGPRRTAGTGGAAVQAPSGTAARAPRRTAAAGGTPTRAPRRTAAAGGTPARAPRRTAAAGGTPARAPRGQNKAQILQSLKTGPKTASQVSQETGIPTRTVGSTLTKLASAGDVVKAQRGYALPG